MRTRPGNSAGEWRSLSSWRAWIEIDPVDAGLLCDGGRSPHGERGLKCGLARTVLMPTRSRSPHGERGLKFVGRTARSAIGRVALLMESVD